MTPEQFLTLLWGDQPPGLIQCWELQTKRSSSYRSPYGTRILNGRIDVYTAVSLAHKDHGRARRARSDQAIAIAGLWLDIDINGGPDNKTDAAPHRDEAHRLASSLASPTVLVNSGHGLQAWWLLDSPWRFATRTEQQHAARLAAQWHELHRRTARARGFGLDSTHDLARLMRLPGTLNGKGPEPVPVEVLDTDGPRYPLEQLRTLCARAGDIPLTAGQLELDGQVDEVTVGAGGEPSDKVQALLANSPDFADTFNHELGPRADGWSMSEYDLSLCSQAARAGFTDQDLADLIACHRARWDRDGAKAGRADYVRRTIGKVRATSERQDALAVLRDLGRAAA
jgi:putative DNA primase/helicase